MKLLLKILAAPLLMMLVSGCIKQQENFKFASLQNPGIGFPFGANNKNDIIIRPATSSQKVSGLLLVTLEAAAPASSDIHISIADNSTALVNAYNLANGTAIQPLPGSLWSIPAELIIKEGDRFTLGDITITNTLGLNTFKQYAVGLTIIAASGSNKIADNLKNLFIIFRIQNQYDGKYSMIGQFYHPTLEPTFAHHNLSIELHTSGPNSVKIYWPIAGQYTIPMTTNGGQPFFIPGTSQGQEPEITIDPVSYAANCNNNFPGSVTFYKPIPAYDGNTYINRWDPATRTIFLAFGYNLGPGGTFIPNVSRAWIDTLTYLGPR